MFVASGAVWKHPAFFSCRNWLTACCQPGVEANVTCFFCRFTGQDGSETKTVFCPSDNKAQPARIAPAPAGSEIGIFPAATIFGQYASSCENVAGGVSPIWLN